MSDWETYRDMIHSWQTPKPEDNLRVKVQPYDRDKYHFEIEVGHRTFEGLTFPKPNGFMILCVEIMQFTPGHRQRQNHSWAKIKGHWGKHWDWTEEKIETAKNEIRKVAIQYARENGLEGKNLVTVFRDDLSWIGVFPKQFYVRHLKGKHELTQLVLSRNPPKDF